MTRTRIQLVLASAIALVASLVSSLPFASAQEPFSIAVFGDNRIDNYLNGAGFSATLVNDAQLSTPGFLDTYDAFFYTRDGAATPGTSLSPTAAANVQEYVGSSGRGVLLNGDFADTIDPALVGTPDPEIQQLISNATTWAATTHHGFIGEYTGAVAGLTSNSDTLAPLGFVSGSAGPLGNGPADGDIVPTAEGESSPVLDGVDFPLTDPTAQLSFGSIVTGVDSTLVLARYVNPGQPNNLNPAIINFAFGAADLSITKTMDGELLNTFVLTAQNAGPDAATTVSISDELDSQLETAEVCHAVTGTETCDDFPAGYDDFVGVIDVGTMSSGATEVYKIRVETDLSLRDGPLSIPNTATIASDGVSDPNTDNNAASLDVDVATVPDPPQINALAPANGRAALNFSQTEDGDGSPDGGSAITGYRVLAQTVSPSSSPCPSVLSSPSVVLTVGPTPNAADGSFSYFVPNLANFTKHCLAVVGVNAVGSSDQSNVEDVIPTDQADANFVPAAGNLTLTINPAGASATKTTKTTYTLTGSAADAGNIVTLAVIPQPPPGEFSCFANVEIPAGVCPGGKIVHSEPGLGNDIHLEIDQIDTTVSTRRTGTLRHVCFTFPCATNTDPYFVYQDARPAILPASCNVNGVYVVGSSFQNGLTAAQAAGYGIPCAVPAWAKTMLANRVLKVQELNNKTPNGNNDVQFQVWIAGDPKRGP
jgi:hypothetical protein